MRTSCCQYPTLRANLKFGQCSFPMWPDNRGLFISILPFGHRAIDNMERTSVTMPNSSPHHYVSSSSVMFTFTASRKSLSTRVMNTSPNWVTLDLSLHITQSLCSKIHLEWSRFHCFRRALCLGVNQHNSHHWSNVCFCQSSIGFAYATICIKFPIPHNSEFWYVFKSTCNSFTRNYQLSTCRFSFPRSSESYASFLTFTLHFFHPRWIVNCWMFSFHPNLWNFLFSH